MNKSVAATALGCHVLLSLGACLTPLEQGRGVEMSGGTPSQSGFDASDCEHLGFLVGRSGGLGGEWLPNDALIESAMNDLRNQAADLGANFIQYDTPTLGVLAGEHGSNTTTATISGVAYRCDERGTPERASDIQLAASTDDSHPRPQKPVKPRKQKSKAADADEPRSNAEEGRCDPKAARSCVGTDGCNGAQVCQEDGATFAPCDCNLGLTQ